jgi:hypothetical protein
MNLKNFSYLAIPVLALGVVGLSSAANHFERGDRVERTPEAMIEHLQEKGGLTLEEATTKMEEMQERKAMHEAFKVFQDDITIVTTNIENGVEKTVTSDNAEAVTAIKERHAAHAEKMIEHQERHDSKFDFNIDHEVVELANGLKVTVTSDSAEGVERIQSKLDGEHGHKCGGKHGKRGWKHGADRGDTTEL